MIQFHLELHGASGLQAKWSQLLDYAAMQAARIVQDAAEEGARAARAYHLYENRTHDLETSTDAERGVTTRRSATALIVARTHYAAYVERHERVGGFMRMALDVATKHLRSEMAGLKSRIGVR
jgi:hypothetical protein